MLAVSSQQRPNSSSGRSADEISDLVSEVAQSGTRTTVPASWSDALGDDFRGEACYVRHFNRPTGLESNTPVHLVIGSVRSRGDVYLNGQRLGECDENERRLGVAQLLEQRNTLAVVVSSDEFEGGIVGEVRIEIG